jgi:hypothetical protein
MSAASFSSRVLTAAWIAARSSAEKVSEIRFWVMTASPWRKRSTENALKKYRAAESALSMTLLWASVCSCAMAIRRASVFSATRDAAVIPVRQILGWPTAPAGSENSDTPWCWVMD